MKYLIILLLIFSTKVFSGPVDGKGFLCTTKVDNNIYEEFFNHYLIFNPHLENNSGLLLLKDRLYLFFT